MAQFSRRTILAAADTVGRFFGHAQIDRFLLRHSLEHLVGGDSIYRRATELAKFLISNPDATNEYGENISDSVMAELIGNVITASSGGSPPEFEYPIFRNLYPELQRALERDGFVIDCGQLRRALPEVLDLPSADNEVHLLLDRHGFTVSKGHLDQGISAHSRGEWAAANAQFRPFIESLFDSLAGASGPRRRRATSRLSEPPVVSECRSAVYTRRFERMEWRWKRLS